MKEREIDKILREKLSEAVDREITPSSEVWSRLESSIAAAQKEGKIPSAAQDATIPPKSKVVDLSEVPAINIRRPRRRKAQWVYIAGSAAAVVLLSLIITTLKINDSISEQPQIADDIEGIEIHDLDDLLRLYEDDLDVQKSLQDAEQVKATSERGAREAGYSSYALAEEEARVEASDVEGDKRAVDSSEPKADERPLIAVVTEDDEKRSTPTTTVKKDTQQRDRSTQYREKEVDEDITSDKKSRRKSAVYTVTSADYGARSKRRTNPFSTSLFAQNIGFSSDDSRQSSGGVFLSTNRYTYDVENLPNKDDKLSQLQTSAPIYREAITVSDIKHRLPISVGFSLSFQLIEKLHIETGVTYSYLHSDWKLNGVGTYKVTQKLHYIGVPVWLRYDIYSNNTLSFYGSAGGAAERAISAKQHFRLLSDGDNPRRSENLKPKGLQMSVGANVGAELKLSNKFGFYVEPGLNYYFKNNQPENYRTKNNLSFNLRAGFRVNM